MTHETIYLKEENKAITLKTYISGDEPEIEAKPRPAVIVIPGGAYFFWSDREGEPIVKRFFAAGFNCFLLHYSIRPHAKFPTPLQDASRAIIHVRENAEKYNIDPDKIFVCGFSAGGHLAAAIGTMWHRAEAAPWPDMPYGMNKPNGMILCYPVITLEPPHAHETCAVEVSGGEVTPEKIAQYSCEKNITENTPPAYIWTTFDDDCVDSENSLMMAAAMKEAGVPFELHIFSKGPHGLATADRETSRGWEGWDLPDVKTWTDEAIAWAKKQ